MVPLLPPSLGLSLSRGKCSYSPEAAGKEQLLMREVRTELDHKAQTADTDFRDLRLCPPHDPGPGNETPLRTHTYTLLLCAPPMLVCPWSSLPEDICTYFSLYPECFPFPLLLAPSHLFLRAQLKYHFLKKALQDSSPT